MSEILKSGGELFVVDSSDDIWQGLKCLAGWIAIGNNRSSKNGLRAVKVTTSRRMTASTSKKPHLSPKSSWLMEKINEGLEKHGRWPLK